MTPEEIRMRCLEAAVNFRVEPNRFPTPFGVIEYAKAFESYVTYTAFDSKNTYHGTPVGTDGEGGETVIL